MAKTFWFRCPDCGESGLIDDDQVNGRVSILCESPLCNFHETGHVRPIIESTMVLAAVQRFELFKNKAEAPPG